MSINDRRPKKLTEYENLLKDILSKPCLKDEDERVKKLTKSPLALPYFVSRLLPNDALAYDALNLGDAKLGHALFEAIRQVYNSLWQDEQPQNYDSMKAALESIRNDIDHDHYHAVHLELRFFQAFLRPSDTSAISDDYLSIGRTEEFRRFKGTIRKVGEMLLSLLGPYRQLLPPRPDGVVGINRNSIQLQAWLRLGQTVSLMGQGGIGKSTLATFVAHDWPHGAFWYTVRPNLNDRLSIFLSELGYFLHQRGCHNLWKLVLTEGGNVQNSHTALNMLAEDLRICQTSLPLFIVDELDRLYRPDPDLAKSQHIEFLEFLESIHGQAPLLFIGQQAVLESDNYLELVGLAPVQIEELLKSLKIISPLPLKPEIERLHSATQGNPRLLLLCIALYEQERAIGLHVNWDTIITNVSQTPGFGPVLNRLWDRLSAIQRELLQRLSVYADSAPQTYWPIQQAKRLKEDAQQLQNLRLIEKGTHGSVSLLPALQERIYNEKLIPNLREHYHLDAAVVLESLGEYTNAAYHLAKGGERNQAIQLWYPVMRREIQRGQSGVAYTIFIDMTYRNLSKDERQALIEIQAHLHNIYGEIQQGLDTIELEEWSERSELQARILALRGRFENALGLRYDAGKSYQRSIDTATRLIAQNVSTYGRYGTAFVHERKFADAERTALAAEQELFILRGIIAFQKNQCCDAVERLEKSLDIAKELNDSKRIALSHQELSIVYMRFGQFEDAICHAEQAQIHYERLGDRLAVAKVDHNLVSIYFEMASYQKCVALGEDTVHFFEAIKIPYFAANTSATVAEAYFELGNYEQAEKMANRVLGHEEPHPTPYAYFTLGLIAEAKGDYQMARLYFKRSLDVAESNEDTFIATYARRGYGKVLCQIGETEEGMEQLHRALAEFERMGKIEEVEATQQVLSTVIT